MEITLHISCLPTTHIHLDRFDLNCPDLFNKGNETEKLSQPEFKFLDRKYFL